MGRRALGLAVACGLAGCSNAFLVRPVFVEEELVERVVDEGDGRLLANKVLVLDVDGLIVNWRDGTLFGIQENPVSLVKEKLQMAEADSRVRAVVLRINSPGGTVTASDIISNEVRLFRQRTKKPVVAMMMDVAASGGYYVACGADRMIAQPTCLTGSIGVLMQWLNFTGMFEWLQLRVETIKGGRHKDMGSPFRELTDEDRKRLQEIVDQYHQRFIDVVARARPNLSPERIRELADGSVYTAVQAKDMGLVDQIGYIDDAIAVAKELAGIRSAKVVTYGREFAPRSTVYAQSPASPAQVNMINVDLGGLTRLRQPRFMYLWAPGQ